VGKGTYSRPKDSNAAVGVRDRATWKALRGLTDKQTFGAEAGGAWEKGSLSLPNTGKGLGGPENF